MIKPAPRGKARVSSEQLAPSRRKSNVIMLCFYGGRLRLQPATTSRRFSRITNIADSAPWITYRPALKVLDCTIRDGGLINNHQFSEKLVRAVYDTCVAAGIDYMEVGYKASPRQHSRSDFGPWKFCDEELLNRLFSDHNPKKTGLKLTVMADADKCDWRKQIFPRQESKL